MPRSDFYSGQSQFHKKETEMSIKRKLYTGAQNDEPNAAKILKEEAFRNLENVQKVNEYRIDLSFSDKICNAKQKRRVAQLKKKKCNSEEKVRKIFETGLWLKIWVIELSDKWLVFCKR